ncbi:hypothetical protein pb186bvf_020413 [Paramecium bursaria]
MKGKIVQQIINQFPLQHQDTIFKCVFVIGYDRIVKKGMIINGVPKINEITSYANKIRQKGRVDETPKVQCELNTLKEEIQKLTQQQFLVVHFIYSRQRSNPPTDDRKRSASVGQRKQREITPKITETIPQNIKNINQNIQINISKHHLDDTEIKQVMRDYSREKPPRPKQCEQVQLEFEDTERNCVPQVLQYSQLQHSSYSHHSEQPNQNQTFAQPSSGKQLTGSKSTHIQHNQPTNRSPAHKSPKFKYQQKVKKLEPVQEEIQQAVKKHSNHSASSRNKSQQQHYNPPQAVSKIKALLDQDKKIKKQQQQAILTVKEYSQEDVDFRNNNSQVANNDVFTLQNKSYSQQQKQQDQKQSIQSFYNQLQSQPIKRSFGQFKQTENFINQLQGSQSTTNQLKNQERKEVLFIQSPDRKQFKFSSESPSTKKQQFRPTSLGKESDYRRSEEFNRSSVSSTFSMFNPNDELKLFFQNDFLERKKYIPQSDLTKQSSVSSYEKSKYITASQIEGEYPRTVADQSNVFQNNRLSVTRILNNSQI